MKGVKIALAADHAGYYMKELIAKFLTNEGYGITDFGTFSDESVDYPDFAHKLALAVENEEYNCGFVFCGSGNGINMTVNKHQGIRSALCWTAEIAQMAKAHNNANVCAIPARYISANEVLDIVKTYLSTEFEGGRHEARIDKIPVQ